MQARRRARRHEPAPFPVVLANCVGWMGYAILAQDFFVFFGAAPGSIIGLFFTIVGYGLTPHGSDMRVYLENVVSFLAVALVAVTFYVGFVARLFFTIDPEGTHERSVMGLFCNAVLVLYYSSPLSTIKRCWSRRTPRPCTRRRAPQTR